MIRALNDDMPCDEFTIRRVAGIRRGIDEAWEAILTWGTEFPEAFRAWESAASRRSRRACRT